jgi:hypothetical protein
MYKTDEIDYDGIGLMYCCFSFTIEDETVNLLLPYPLNKNHHHT